jgi:hypothetical protein
MRKENDHLRAQLNLSPNRSPMDAQRADQTTLPEQNKSSPFRMNNNLKRKADDNDDQSSRVRDFRRELNANSRLGMPTPTLPIPPASRQSSHMLQHDRPAQPFISRDDYNTATGNGFRQDDELNKEQSFHRSNDEEIFIRPQKNSRQNFSEQGQNYQRLPPTPQQPFFARTDIPQTPVGSNPPFRSPFPGTRSYTSANPQQENRISYLSPPTSRPGLEHHYRGNSNPNVTPSKGRISLPPQSSDHRYTVPILSRSQTMNMGSSGASPFFSRPSSVAAGFGGNGVNTFGGEFLQRPQSSRPNANQVTGGLGELLRGSGGFMDRPGLRRTVRRD